jgi:hypothetical protein
MNEVSKASPNGDFDLGQWIGRRQAFGLIAGRCSAADAECIRRIRDEKLYRNRNADWGEFCEQHLHMSRSNADRLIRLLERFGPDYFQISQITRVSADQYRAIAPLVAGGCLQVDGESVPLTPENSERIAAAVATFRQAARPPAAERTRLAALEAECGRLLRAFREERKHAGSPDPQLTAAVESLAQQAARLALEVS